jgi:hypothetical protein
VSPLLGIDVMGVRFAHNICAQRYCLSQPGLCWEQWVESNDQCCSVPAQTTWGTVSRSSEFLLLVVCASLQYLFKFSHMFYLWL